MILSIWQNKSQIPPRPLAIFSWQQTFRGPYLTGFLVMFMQLGFALLETGLTRRKNVTHTMGMNIFVYAVGILCFWAVGFGLQMGGVGALATFGNDATLANEFSVSLGGKDFGLFGTTGFFLSAATYTPAIAVLFLFQMVFMDTAATIPTGAMAERWKFCPFASSASSSLRSSIRSMPIGFGGEAGFLNSARASVSATDMSTSQAARSCT